MTVPDVIERRECPECGADGDSYAENAHWSWCARGGVHVTRRYVAVDALLRDDVVNVVRARFVLTFIPTADQARAALAAAVKHLTGGER